LWREHPESTRLSDQLSECQRREKGSNSSSDADSSDASDDFDERQENADYESDDEQSAASYKQSKGPEVLTSKNPFELLVDDDD
jgi:hypothetical protein